MNGLPPLPVSAIEIFVSIGSVDREGGQSVHESPFYVKVSCSSKLARMWLGYRPYRALGDDPGWKIYALGSI